MENHSHSLIFVLSISYGRFLFHYIKNKVGLGEVIGKDAIKWMQNRNWHQQIESIRKMKINKFIPLLELLPICLYGVP